MNYRIIPVTAFAQNCSLIWCEQTRLAALVDPGGDAGTYQSGGGGGGRHADADPADAWPSRSRRRRCGTGAALWRTGYWSGKRR